MPLPSPRGPVSAALLGLLAGPPTGTPSGGCDRSLALAELIEGALAHCADLLTDDDLQATLYCRYALHLHGLPGVDDRWEWHPALASATAMLETAFEDALRVATADTIQAAQAGDALSCLTAMARLNLGPSLSQYLARRATREQFVDFVRVRSVYQLKEADPHTWAIPRLRGRAKSALVEIQGDEYGNGIPARMHSTLFAQTMRSVGLDDTLGSQVDDVPAVVLAADNAAVMFGLHRRLRGAVVGHLAALEMTSALPMQRYARAATRLGLGTAGSAYFDEHVEADAVHEQVALHDLVAPLIAAEPDLVSDVLFGAATCLVLDAAVAAHLLSGWEWTRTPVTAGSVR
ncbi:MAG: iron-containing redox enzyme family protein [Austwickia sp.]|nr:iron-containing redox enzyme family protein [Austwickia sp.]